MRIRATSARLQERGCGSHTCVPGPSTPAASPKLPGGTDSRPNPSTSIRFPHMLFPHAPSWCRSAPLRSRPASQGPPLKLTPESLKSIPGGSCPVKVRSKVSSQGSELHGKLETFEVSPPSPAGRVVTSTHQFPPRRPGVSAELGAKASGSGGRQRPLLIQCGQVRPNRAQNRANIGAIP